MAKALVGYIGGIDPRKVRESGLLRQRIVDLESEVRRLKQENDALAAACRAASTERHDDLGVGLEGLDPRVLEPVVR